MTENKDPGALILAAGGIVEKQTPNGPLIVLVYRELYGGDWSLPKGKQDPGESLQETAKREVLEETGCPARFIGFAGVNHYFHGERPKVVFYWHMALEAEGAFTPSTEVSKVAWFSPEEALTRMAYADEQQLVKKIYNLE